MKGILRKIALALSVTALSLAAVCNSFSISPLKYHLTLAPGTTNSDVFVDVVNPSSDDAVFEISILSARQLESGRLVYENKNSGAETWVTPNKKTLQLKSQSEERVGFKIAVPADAVAGSYYIGLAVKSSSADAGKNVGVSGQLISVLLLQVSGIVNETLSVQKWTLPEFMVGKKWPASFAIVNTGVTELPIKGEIIVRDWLDREIAREEVVLGAALLPQSGRGFSTEVKLKNTFLLPGLYDAELKIEYGLTKQSAVALKSVWYVPPYFWMLIIGLTAIGIIIFKCRKKIAYVK